MSPFEIATNLLRRGRNDKVKFRNVLPIIKYEFPTFTEWCSRLTKLVAKPIMRGEKLDSLRVNLENNGTPFDQRIIELEPEVMDLDD